MPSNPVKEVQGFYGPFTLSEHLIQKIWLRQDFSSKNLKTVSGKKLVVKDPGIWNSYEGPDFKEARLMLDGVEVNGDVEVHINLLDWRHHQHERDKNYDRVLLHVVLYCENANQVSQVQTSRGHMPELLYLMPFLNRDLESYAMEDALLKLEQQDELEWVSKFTELPFEQRFQILKQQSLRRWQQKLAYAKQRLDAEGWEVACHSYALEVLGYKRNRIPMIRLAEKYPLARMRKTLLKHQTLTGDRLFDEERAHWKLNGLRPANHPRKRLSQYLELVARQPHWPDRLVNWIQKIPVPLSADTTAEFRRTVNMSALRKEISESLFCSIISEKRLNTLIVDALLPLVTAAELLDGSAYWQHWFAGDSPDVLSRFLRRTGVLNRQNPMSNGAVQGVLGLFLDQRG